MENTHILGGLWSCLCSSKLLAKAVSAAESRCCRWVCGHTIAKLSPMFAKVNSFNYNIVRGFCGWIFCGFHKMSCRFQANNILLNESLSVFSVTIVAIQYQSGSTIMLKILCPLPSSVWFLWVVCNSAILNHTRMILNLPFLVLDVFVCKILHLNCFIIFLG